MKFYFSILVIFIFIILGCSENKESQYIPTHLDSIPNDKNNMGLRGKVKTMDVYYFYPETETSLFVTTFKKGEKWNYNESHHLSVTFTENGQMLESSSYDVDDNYIASYKYIYEKGILRTKIDSSATNKSNALVAIVYQFDNKGNHLETVHKYADGTIREKELNTYDEDGQLLKSIDRETGLGEINDYDKNGNLIRKELLTDIISHAFSLTEYVYNSKNLLTEKREFYNKIELYKQYVYTYNDKDLLEDMKVYRYHVLEPYLDMHYEFKYDTENRLSAKYEVYKDSTSEVLAEYEYRNYPNGNLHFVIKNGSVIEEYDELGNLSTYKNITPGFEIIDDLDKNKYKLDHFRNWTEMKDFNDYVELGLEKPSGLIQITAPYVERKFTYYE